MLWLLRTLASTPAAATASCSATASATPRSAVVSSPSTALACRCATVSGLAGSRAATASPTNPPTSASTIRLSPAAELGGSSVATSTAEDADWSAITVPPSSSTAADMASATARATCHGPVPIAEMSTSPTPMPRDTPTISSTTRRSRWPSEMPSETTAAIGAKNAWLCPITSCASSQASPAASAACAIGSAVRCQRRNRPANTSPSAFTR